MKTRTLIEFMKIFWNYEQYFKAGTLFETPSKIWKCQCCTNLQTIFWKTWTFSEKSEFCLKKEEEENGPWKERGRQDQESGPARPAAMDLHTETGSVIVIHPIHESIFQSPEATHGFILRYLANLDINACTRQKQGRTTQRALQVPKWIPPAEGMVKINVDGGIANNRCKGRQRPCAATPREFTLAHPLASLIIVMILERLKQ